MTTISLRRLGFTAAMPLFDDLSFTLSAGDRLGVVAGNGAGKSTLLRCIAGEQAPTRGEVARARGLRVALVAQHMPEALAHLTLREAVRRGVPAERRAAEAWRGDALLEDWGATKALLGTALAALSGGWRRLAMLARALVGAPDALLLDEPTTHLDAAHLAALEAVLRGAGRPPILVTASHDRRFLDRCTDRTLFLRGGEAALFAHPYTRARALLAEADAAAAGRLQRDGREAERLRRSAATLRNIGVNSHSDAAQKKSAQLARRAEDMQARLAPPPKERSGLVRLAARAVHARVVFGLDGLSVAAPDGRTLFRAGRLSLMRGDRVVVLGPNGSGKSLLVAALRRALAAPGSVAGIATSAVLDVGYLDQHMSHLPEAASPLQVVGGLHREGDRRSRALLAGAGIAAERQDQPIAGLTPGQRARLALLALRLEAPGFFLLDEPTNHLDIAGQEALEAEILGQDASALLVTHDRAFAAAVATRAWRIEAGRLEEVDVPR